MRKICPVMLCVVVLGGCRNDKSQKKNRPLAPWPPVRSGVSLADRPSFQLEFPRLVVMRWFSFRCRLESDGLHDVTKAENHRYEKLLEGVGGAGVPVFRSYNIWGRRADVLALLETACAALAACPGQQRVAILNSPDSARDDPLLTAARQVHLASDESATSGETAMLYLSVGLRANTGRPDELGMSAMVGSLRRVDGKYRVTAPDKQVASAVRAACSEADPLSALSVTSFGEGRVVVRKNSREGFSVEMPAKGMSGVGESQDVTRAGTVILEFPALSGTPSAAATRPKALWTPAGEIVGQGFDNIARVDPKDGAWEAELHFVAYGLGVVGKLDRRERDSGGTELLFTVVDAVVARGLEANEGKE